MASTHHQRESQLKGTRWLLLKNPWNLNNNQKERLSTLVRWNSPLVRAWYLKESFQLFWTYEQPYPAMADIAGHLAFYPDKVKIEEVA